MSLGNSCPALVLKVKSLPTSKLTMAGERASADLAGAGGVASRANRRAGTVWQTNTHVPKII